MFGFAKPMKTKGLLKPYLQGYIKRKKKKNNINIENKGLTNSVENSIKFVRFSKFGTGNAGKGANKTHC